MSKARDIADLDFNSPDIDGGNIDGATIGATTPAAGTFSGLSSTGNATFTGSITSASISCGALTSSGEIGIAPASGTAKLRLTSQGTGSEVFSVNGQIPGVSNTGFAIRNETDSRNDFYIDGGGGATFSSTVLADSFQFTQNSSAIGATEAIYRNTTGTISVKAGSNVIGSFDGANNLVTLGGQPSGNVQTHGVVVSNELKGTLGSTLGDTARVLGIHNQSHNNDYLTFRTRRITDGQTGWNHAVWDITRDIDNTSNLYQYCTFGIGEFIVNDQSGNLDFRVESDSNTHALFVDASANGVMFGNTALSLASGYADQHGVGIDCGTGQTQISGDGTCVVVGRTSTGGAGTLFDLRLASVQKGTIDVSSTGVTYATTSDLRLKTNIKSIDVATNKLMAMNPVSHKWKADPEADEVHGFIAQEMMEIVPEAVNGDPESDEMMSMDYGRITPIIVAALQEANNKIMELENRINEMEGN